MIILLWSLEILKINLKALNLIEFVIRWIAVKLIRDICPPCLNL